MKASLLIHWECGLGEARLRARAGAEGFIRGTGEPPKKGSIETHLPRSPPKVCSKVTRKLEKTSCNRRGEIAAIYSKEVTVRTEATELG